MRAAWLLIALFGVAGCKDKSETRPATSSDDTGSAALAAGSSTPKLERERDRFGNIPGRVTEKQRDERMQRLGKTLLRLDKNKDNKVTLAELQASEIDYLTFDDPKSVDADGDGEISVEELDVAIDNRRQKSRERWKVESGRY